MNTSHYSLARAKKSLFFYLVGKPVSALFGVAILLLTVRAMQIEEYGTFVALLALLEILYLISGFGLSFIVQRYVPEYRLQLIHGAFSKAISMLLLRRLGYSALAATVFYLAATPLLRLLDLDSAQPLLGVYVLLIVLGCQVRIIDELLPALMLQGYAQLSLLIRNIAKFAGVAYAYGFLQTLSLRDALLLELAAASLSLVLALALLMRYLRANKHECGQVTELDRARKAGRGALRFYAAQIFGQLYSANAIKLVISSSFGSGAVAAYGFAQSLVDMLGNYQPATLLATWIRPVVVSRYVQYKDAKGAFTILFSVFKTGFVALAPAIALLVVYGDDIGHWLSKGKFDHSGWLLAGLMCVVVLQGLHQLLSMAVVAFDQTATLLRATVACGLISILFAMVIERIGIHGVLLWLGATEMTWIGIVAWALRSRGFFPDAISYWPYCKLLGIAAVTYFTAHSISAAMPASTLNVAAGFISLFLVAAVGGLLSRIYSEGELTIFGKIVPARFIRILGRSR